MKTVWINLKGSMIAFFSIHPVILAGNILFLGVTALGLWLFIEHLKIHSTSYSSHTMGYQLFVVPYLHMLIYALYCNLLDWLKKRLFNRRAPADVVTSEQGKI